MKADSMRQLVRSIASDIAPFDKLEVEHQADVLDWIDSGTITTLSLDEGEFAEVRWWGLEDITKPSTTRFDPHLPRFVAKLMAATAQAD